MNSHEKTESPSEVLFHTKDITLRKKVLLVDGFDRKSLAAFLKMFAEETYRIKGFAKCNDEILLVDCVGPIVEVRDYDGIYEEINQLTVLYGKGLNPLKRIKEVIQWFPESSASILQGE